ncbi:hypothetical protein H9C73_02960 [Marinobacterium sp. AK62]|uniref:Uncharacterized protein n=1 Tax=Marinobacterium alkalitolerans TaxID=1542925 RepID=A0ABS3Z9I3_9GAMM|nr:hypothetical protein [Marinobacterium alkalitolerans]MBP0047684.1 hypothetical protein [Marinobacterium alkalitolerans]
MSAYLEFIYVGDGQHGVETKCGAMGKNDQWAYDEFERLQEQQTDMQTAPYILDLWSNDDDLIDSIGISTELFEQLTGKKHRDWFQEQAA